MRGRANQNFMWIGISLIVVLYALVPVAWIVSLSLKPGAELNNGKFLPSSATFDNYTQIFDQSIFTSALRNSIGIALISTFIAVVLATRSRWSARSSTSGGGSVSTTRGSA
jgi:multiple sugar transport system permease protein